MGRKSGDKSDSLRNKILAVLSKSKASVDDMLKALSQCQSHILSRMATEEIARECGLKLARYTSNQDLEFYYDIHKGRHCVGYISKGWKDPGFRIGDVIRIPERKAGLFQVNAYHILRFCAVRGITMTVEETKDAIEVHMDGVIYSDGFNKNTFTKTLETLNECVEKIRELTE